MGNPVKEQLLKRDGRPVVVIVGGGCTGIATAISLLEKNVANIVVVEKSDQLGGNAASANVRSSSGATYQVGACVTNFSCPTFQELSSSMTEVSIPVQAISTDFSVVGTARNTLLSRIDGALHCDRSIGNSNYASQQFQRILDVSKQDFLQGKLANTSAASYFRNLCETENFYNSLPIPKSNMDADEVVRFWISHGIMIDTLQPNFSVGGIGRYAKDFKRALQDQNVEVKLATNVSKLIRKNGVSIVHLVDAECNETEIVADYVIMACHASEALKIIRSPTLAEIRGLSMFSMKRNRIVVHSDESLMGKDSQKWGAFNFISREVASSVEDAEVMTYYCNRLIKLPEDMPHVFVSINPISEPDMNKILADAIEAKDSTSGERKREAMKYLNLISGGSNKIWFTGSYTVTQEQNDSGWCIGKKCGEQVAEIIETSFSFPIEEDVHISETQSVFEGCISIFNNGACASIT